VSKRDRGKGEKIKDKSKKIKVINDKTQEKTPQNDLKRI